MAQRASARRWTNCWACARLISQAVEAARQEKAIGNALEAEVTLHVADAGLRERLAGLDAELEEFFILSDLKITGGSGRRRRCTTTTVSLRPTEYRRCERCWRHRFAGRHDGRASDALRPLRGRGDGTMDASG